MKRVDFDVSVAVGLGVSFPLYKILTLPDYCGTPDPLSLGDTVALLVVFASYLIVPLLLRLLPGQRVVRLGWLWTPVLGSLLLAVAHYFGIARSAEWGVEQSAKVWFVLCLWTLPIAAAVYYSGMIVRGLRKWHEGSNDNLSILQR